MAVVSVARTGMAWSSLECWLFILSAVAWPEVGVRSASRTQAAARRLWSKVASTTGACERGPVGDVAWRWLEAHTLIIEVVLKSSSESLISLPNHEGAGW